MSRKENGGSPNMLRLWLAMIIFGLFGQIAWTVENMYFNVFLYDIEPDTTLVAALVAASAIAAALTTIIMGAFSDRVRKRKPFIVAGYILWGFSTMAFALVADKVGTGLRTAAILVIVLDCVMTFFGSTANDAVFNAWVAEISPEKKRGRIEAVLAVMPLIAMLVVFGALDGLKQQGQWGLFFLIVGAVITVGGILGMFFIQEPKRYNDSTERDGYWRSIAYGFRPSVAKSNKSLYLALVALCVYSISWQVFMPYLLIYIEQFLGITDYVIILAVVLTVGSLLSVLLGRLIDKVGRVLFCVIAIIAEAAGLVWFSLVRDDGGSNILFMAAGILFIAGGMLVTACLSTVIRSHLPEGRAGQLQGVRIVFYVLIPMVTGPYIGDAVINHIGKIQKYGELANYEELGTVKSVPVPEIFIMSAAVLMLTFIPLIFLARSLSKEKALAGAEKARDDAVAECDAAVTENETVQE